jgi:hypothetical protein
MTIDLSPLAAVLLPLVQAVVLAAVPLLLVWLRRHLTLMQDANLSRAIADCVGRGAGLTYQVLAAAGGSVGSVTLTNAAVAQGVQSSHFPAATRCRSAAARPSPSTARS